MKLDEFKAWFEGFTESMEGAPTAKQWKRIKERVGEIDGVPISHTVYVDRYWPSVQPLYYRQYPTWTFFGNANIPTSAQCYSAGTGNAQIFGAGHGKSAHDVSSNNYPGVPAFDSHSAMYAAGKAEALQ